jgi:glycosyltransferase involved in cell wall biosynthesis
MPVTPDLTVIIPAKIRTPQELDWLSLAIQSVYKQKGVKPLILVGNDHSDIDPSLKAVELTNLRWLNLPDGLTGLAANRNYLMSQVTTKYFFPLDADDLLPPEALKTALEAYTGDGFLYGSTILFDETSQTLFAAQPFDFAKLLTQVYWPSGALQLTENWAKVKWDETLPAYEDWDYWIRSGEAGICGHALSSVLYWYRRNPQGIISKLNSDPALKQKAVDRIREKHSKLYTGGIQMCCGRDGLSASLNQQSQQSLAGLPGAEGFVTIEYQGGNSGDMVWYGVVTGTRYVAGGITRLVSVDIRDALTGASKKPGLLELVEYGKYVFKEYVDPVKAQPVPQTEPVAQASETSDPDVAQTPNVAQAEFPVPQEAPQVKKPSGKGRKSAASK